MRPAKLGTVVGQQLGGGDQRDADITLKSQNLCLEGWVEFDLPFQIGWNLYSVNGQDTRGGGRSRHRNTIR